MPGRPTADSRVRLRDGKTHVEWLAAAAPGVDSKWEMQLYGLVRTGSTEKAIQFLRRTQRLSRDEAAEGGGKDGCQIGDCVALRNQGERSDTRKDDPCREGDANGTAEETIREASHQPTDQGNGRLYTLEVFLLGGPTTEKFATKNPVVSRTIQLRGGQTLEDLHHAIFDAFGRWEEHMYEFQFGKGPMDPKAPRYVLPGAFETNKKAGRTHRQAGSTRPASSRWAWRLVAASATGSTSVTTGGTRSTSRPSRTKFPGASSPG